MSKYPRNFDDGELTPAEQRRLIDEAVTRRMQAVSDDHLADYWTRKKRHEERQAADAQKAPNNAPRHNQPYPPYDPSELHELRDVLTEDVRERVMAMVTFSLDGENQQDP